MSGNDAFILETRGITRRFGDLTAVSGVTLEVRRGEIFGLLGPDGAGKTTMLRLLCGLLDPNEGEVFVDGRSIEKAGDEARDKIGYMAQRFGLYGDLTVDENMTFYADLFGVPLAERRARTERLLAMTRMAEFRTRQAGRLSGGMKQKLALMCVLLHRPEILLLDEPTNGVDPVSRRDFWAILYELVRDGVTILVTTAYLDEAERCNRIGLMHKGRLVWTDTPEAVRKSPRETLYAIDCGERAKAREALNGAPGVSSIEPFGARVHLFLDEEMGSVDDLARRLREVGLECALERIEPSLEDVFILLIRKEEARAPAEARP
jgi:ABC-2 type transport system ATP-binding protein